MKNRFLRTFLILFLIAVLCAGGVYAAARYGTQDDPLVTMSYLRDVAEREITDRTDSSIQSAVSTAKTQVEESAREAMGVFRPVELTAGQTLRCDPGAEVLLTAGTAVSAGDFTDTTAGEPLAPQNAMAVNHLYLAGEGASLQTAEGASVMVRGGYTVG